MRIHAKLALATAAPTALLAPLTTAPAAATPTSAHHAANTAVTRQDLPEPPSAPGFPEIVAAASRLPDDTALDGVM